MSVLTRRHLLLSTTCAATGQPALADAAPGGGPPRLTEAQRAELLDGLKKWAEEVKLPGAALSLSHRGTEFFREIVGNYTPETVISLASATKWLTGATFLRLEAAGKLKLEDRVSSFLPEFKGEKGEMTLAHCLSHTSGLPGDHPAEMNFRITLEEAVRQYSELPLMAAPGAEFRYGGISMCVAGRVAEVILGRPWSQIFAEYLTEPLGMTRTRFGRLGLLRNPNLAGGASSTLNDYLHFLQMLNRGGRHDGKEFLSPKSMQRLHRNWSAKSQIKSAALTRRLNSNGYAIGNWVDTQDKDGNQTANSSPGAFGTVPWVDWQTGISGLFWIEDRQRMRRGNQVPNLREVVGKILSRS